MLRFNMPFKLNLFFVIVFMLYSSIVFSATYSSNKALFNIIAGQEYNDIKNIEVNNITQNGTIFEIKGRGFGRHIDNSPNINNFLGAAWNSLEDSLFNKGGMRLTADYPENWRMVSGKNNRNGSNFHVSKFYNSSRLGAFFHKIKNSQGQIYATFWFMNDGTPLGKLARLYADKTNIYVATGGDNFGARAYAEYVGARTIWSSPDQLTPQSWYRIDFFNTANGETKIWIDGKEQWTKNWLPEGTNFNGHTFDIGNLINKSDNNSSFNFDDIYINYTVARVEICDAPTWDEKTKRHCEIQIPLSWVDNGRNIKVQANWGSFDEGDTVYLYVINSSGIVSNKNRGIKFVINDK